jgi:hypothetical protein
VHPGVVIGWRPFLTRDDRLCVQCTVRIIATLSFTVANAQNTTTAPTTVAGNASVSPTPNTGSTNATTVADASASTQKM